MKLLDRRFLNLSLSVLAVADEPADNPATGSQYIVGANPAGAFAGAAANSIARFNGTAWEFFAPKAGGLEVINCSNSEILQFNGTAWVAVASFGGNSPSSAAVVSTVIQTGAALPDNPAEGDTFLNTTDGKLYTAGSSGWDAGSTPAEGEAFLSVTDGKVYTADGNGNLTPDTTNEGELFFNKHDSSLYTYDAGTQSIVKVSSVPAEHFTETHSLTAAEAAAKSFQLTHSVATGQERNILCFVSGIAQAAGVDFTVSGRAVSWDSLGLDDIGLEEGDIFIVNYIMG